VKFLVDAQLPARLAGFLQQAGHDAVHTSALPTGNRTTDTQITRIADGQSRVVVTKDRDFRDGHLLSGSPRRLLVVATGNITNTELLALFQNNLDTIVDAFVKPTSLSWDRTRW
jgi:predicted nuclease of predicted toxin-antitoxin system